MWVCRRWTDVLHGAQGEYICHMQVPCQGPLFRISRHCPFSASFLIFLMFSRRKTYPTTPPLRYEILVMIATQFLPRVEPEFECGDTHMKSQHFKRLKQEDCTFKPNLGNLATDQHLVPNVSK